MVAMLMLLLPTTPQGRRAGRQAGPTLVLGRGLAQPAGTGVWWQPATWGHAGRCGH